MNGGTNSLNRNQLNHIYYECKLNIFKRNYISDSCFYPDKECVLSGDWFR